MLYMASRVKPSVDFNMHRMCITWRDAIRSAEAMRLDRRDERHGAGGVVPATTPLTLVPKPARPRPLGRALSLTPACLPAGRST